MRIWNVSALDTPRFWDHPKTIRPLENHSGNLKNLTLYINKDYSEYIVCSFFLNIVNKDISTIEHSLE